MKISVQKLRAIIDEVKKVAASPEYMSKEAIREALQKLILAKVADIDSDEQLADMFKTMDMAMMALKQVPLGVWKTLASSDGAPTVPTFKKR